MPKPPPTFEFSFPTAGVKGGPPYVQVVYGDEPLDPVPLETAKLYSRFMMEALPYATSPDRDLCVERLPVNETVDSAYLQFVIRGMIDGHLEISMAERLEVLRACRLLKVDVLQLAIEDHLNQGCKSRPTLKLECLQEVFDLPEDDPFRRERMNDARENFHVIVNNPLWATLNADIVRELLSDDKKLKIKETDLYQAVLRWLACNPVQIPAQCDRLLSMIRFGSMSTGEKFNCLDQARRLGLDDFVKPYVIEADWYRTCLELNHPEFTDLIEYDRLTYFVGENRRQRMIEAHLATKPPSEVDADSPVFKRALEGKIDGGTWVPRTKKRSP